MSRRFHALRVAEAEAETEEAVTLRFEVPAALADVFRWRAGQHVGVRFAIDGAEERRTYTISDAPAGGACLQITVKRVEGGLVSNHIGDRIEVGDVVEVTPPFGGFRLDPEPRARRTYYFFAAGSGITPIYAMARAALEGEPHSVARLAYGNRDARSIIFRERLDKLAAEAGPGRLIVRHVLSQAGWRAGWRTGAECWRRGRIDAAAVRAFIEEHPPEAQDARYYVCGPGGMNAAVRNALRAIDVPTGRIRAESFGGRGGEAERDLSVEGVAATAAVILDGKAVTVRVEAGETILEAARRAGVEPPFSCQSGVCGSCRARLAAGRVHMRARMALDEAEVAAGAVLTCQAVPVTAELEVRFG